MASGPSRFNLFNLVLLALLVVVGYGAYLFGPIYLRAFRVRHTLQGDANGCYQTARLGEPQRSHALYEQRTMAIAELRQRLEVTAPDLQVQVLLVGEEAVVSADWTEVVQIHPEWRQTIRLKLHREGRADVKRVEW